MKVSVFGAGSWGTALSHHLRRRGHEVMIWSYEPEIVEGLIEGRNPRYLSDLELASGLQASSNVDEVADYADAWLWVVPTQFSRAVLDEIELRSQVSFVCASKGFESGTMLRMDELAWETLNLPPSRFIALSGPTFAREIIEGQPSAAVIACTDGDRSQFFQEAFSDEILRLYATTDVVGVETGGALKNVIAIAAGVIDGLGHGKNTQAALMTRGLHEITRMAVAMGGYSRTLAGLAGMGDLVLTCTGSLSRNRTVGQRLGRGETLEQILASTNEVAEGVRTAPAALHLAISLGVEMPITEAVTRLLNGTIDAPTALIELMTRRLKDESQL